MLLILHTHLSNLGNCFRESNGRILINILSLRYFIIAYSTDGGKSFTDPQKVNPLSIVGQELLNVDNMLAFGKMTAISSTNQEALISWVGTKEGQGTQAYLTRVKR